MVKVSVLVVDDSSCQRLAWAVKLAQCVRIQPSTARDGMEALQSIIAGNVPNILITDLDMPHMNGETLMTEVLKRHPSLPIFVLSSGITKEIRDRFSKNNVRFFDKAHRDSAFLSVIDIATEQTCGSCSWYGKCSTVTGTKNGSQPLAATASSTTRTPQFAVAV